VTCQVELGAFLDRNENELALRKLLEKWKREDEDYNKIT